MKFFLCILPTSFYLTTAIMFNIAMLHGPASSMGAEPPKAKPSKIATKSLDPKSLDDVTLALAKLAIETKSDEIPEKACFAAKKAVIDTLGCAMAGYQAPGVPEIIDLTKDWGGREEATLWFHGGKVPGPAATFANSVQVHALDMDEYHHPSGTHITSLVVPVAFAMAELNDASGKETLDAVVLGVEVACRLGRACRSRRAHGGFLPASVIGGFGATAAACRLQGCSTEQTVHAMGIWYAHASGNRQALLDRTLTKRIQPAIAARAGAFASYLAQKDLTGPRRIIEGQPASLIRIYGFKSKGPKITVKRVMEPHDFYEVEKLSYKRYVGCGGSHYAVQAAHDLTDKHDLKPEQIEKVEIYGVEVNGGMTGWPWQDSDNPHVMAQFCAPYSIASVIKNHRFGPAEITLKRIAEDREVDALARRCELHYWKDWGSPPPARQAVRIFMKDGRKLEAWHNTEEVLWPTSMTYKQLTEKFKSNVTISGLVNQKQAQKMLEAIEKLDQFDSITKFVNQYLVFEGK